MFWMGYLSCVLVVSSHQALVPLCSRRAGPPIPVSDLSEWFCLDSLPQASQPLGQEWERDNQGALTAEWRPCRSILSRDPIIHLLSFHFLVTAPRKDRVESGLFLVEEAGGQSRINRKLAAELGWCPKVGACLGKRCLPYLMPLLL